MKKFAFIDRAFWISWATGKVRVGSGRTVDGSKQFMELAVTDSLTVGGMAVTTGYGSSGVWKIINPHGQSVNPHGQWSLGLTV